MLAELAATEICFRLMSKASGSLIPVWTRMSATSSTISALCVTNRYDLRPASVGVDQGLVLLREPTAGGPAWPHLHICSGDHGAVYLQCLPCCAEHTPSGMQVAMSLLVLDALSYFVINVCRALSKLLQLPGGSCSTASEQWQSSAAPLHAHLAF